MIWWSHWVVSKSCFCHWSHLSFDPGLGGHFFFQILISLIKKSIMWSFEPRKTLCFLHLMTLNGAILILFLYLHFVDLFKVYSGFKILPFKLDCMSQITGLFVFPNSSIFICIEFHEKQMWIIIVCFLWWNAKSVMRLFCFSNAALTCLKWAASCPQTPSLLLE